MSQLRIFLRCVGQAICAKGVKALMSLVPMGEVLFEIAEDAGRRLQQQGEPEAQRAPLAAAASASTEEARREATKVVAELRARGELPAGGEAQLAAYLERVPSAVRQSLRRPADPSGKTVPAGTAIDQPEQLAAMLPSRLPRFKSGVRPAGVGNWELVELLGAGGFGEVWKAKHPTLAGIQPVALKFCLDPSAAAVLRHEAALLDRVMQQGTHPGIVPLRQAYLDADPLCLEYEFVGGGDLIGVINGWHKGGKPPLRQVNAAILTLAKIVAHAHGLTPSIVHRDLKPANVLVHRSGDNKVRLRVADFGIGGVAAQAAETMSKKASPQGVLATSLRGSHTPLYASPQQMRGEAPDPRDDVHALGVMWYQMLTGDLSSGVPADWMSVLQELGQASSLIRLLGECVTSRAEKRIADAGELASRLELVLRGEALVELEAEDQLRPVRSSGAETVRPAPPARPQKAAPAPTRRGQPRRSREERPEAPWHVRPLVVLGGVGGLAFVAVLVVVLTLSGKGRPEPHAEPLPAKSSDKNPVDKGEKPLPPSEAPIDLIAMLDLDRDVIGQSNREMWRRDGTSLVFDWPPKTSGLPRIQFPYRPPEEYDFTVRFRKPQLQNGIALIIPKPGGRSGSFTWFIAGGGSTCGFGGEKALLGKKQGGLLVADKLHTTVVQVRRNRLLAFIDGVNMVDAVPDYPTLDREMRQKLNDESLLGLYADERVTFESAQLIEVSGRGLKLR